MDIQVQFDKGCQSWFDADINRALPFCAVWASADVVYVVVDVDLVFVDNEFYYKWIFMYN